MWTKRETKLRRGGESWKQCRSNTWDVLTTTRTEAELRTFTFVDGGPITADANSSIDGEDGAAIEETPESLERLKDQRRENIVKNVNRPAERRNSLSNFQNNQEIPN